MEDAHAAVLNLEGSDEKNAFFAVYDGHGGTCFSQQFKIDSFLTCTGSSGGTVAKFAGQHLHKRLVTEDAYREKRFNEALKKAFLGIDEDLLAGTSLPSIALPFQIRTCFVSILIRPLAYA